MRLAREAGFGVLGLLATVSIFATVSIVFYSTEAQRLTDLTERQIQRSQAELDLYSALTLTSSIVKAEHSGKKPIENNLWQRAAKSGGAMFGPYLVKSAGLKELNEEDWSRIAGGVSSNKQSNTPKVKVTVHPSKLGDDRYLLLKASIEDPSTGQLYRKSAQIDLVSSGASGSDGASGADGASGSGGVSLGGPSKNTCEQSHSFNGYCFYLGGKGESCSRTCAKRNLSYNHSGTAGANSKNSCRAIMKKLTGKSSLFVGFWRTNRAGCKFNALNRRVYVTPSVAANDQGFRNDHRVCACS